MKGTATKSEETIVHHIHHNQESTEEYKRVISLTGSMATVTISSSNPKESITFLCDKALDLFKRVKAVDQHE